MNVVCVCVCIPLLAIAAAVAVVAGQGPLDRPIDGDGRYYIALARAMASGKGYMLEASTGDPWPDRPHLSSLPLWPLMLTPGEWLFPHANEFTVLRSTAIFFHGIAASLLALFTYRMWRDLAAAFLAGVLFALYPPALALVDEGMSEHSYVVTATAGFLLLFTNRPGPAADWKAMAGAGLLGLSALARGNILLLPFFFAGIGLALQPSLCRHWKRMAILTIIFLTPATFWILRNYHVSGEFPVLSAVEGETFYGGNNAFVATDLTNWGYWTFPNNIPGETPKFELAKRMNEIELNRYYKQKGMEYIRENWFAYPRLILGKLIRGFVPVPFVPVKATYLAFLIRLILYIAFLRALRRRIIQDQLFLYLLIALFAVTVATTLIYYGTYRFTFCLEIYMICCVAASLVNAWRHWRTRGADSPIPV